VTIGRDLSIVVRAAAGAAPSADTLRALVHDIDPTMPIHGIRPLSTDMAATAADSRLAAAVMTLFAALALTLATVGLYGALVYATTRRTRELGIRTALGASRFRLIVLVAMDGMLATAAGVAAGLAVAAGGAQVLRGLLFGIEPLDSVSFLTAPLILALTAGVACVLPAWRGAAIDPAETLRHD
jgi:putative ABC transport system permease protein